MDQQVIGLDVSKAWLDGYVASSGRRLRVSNDAAGVQELVGALGDRAGCLVMEASGGYERTAHRLRAPDLDARLRPGPGRHPLGRDARAGRARPPPGRGTRAPVAKDSGLRENRRVIKGGRGQIRRALYMAAVASLRIKAGPLKQRYAQLVANGKAPKLALTALMRNMLVTLNAMLKARQAWRDPREA
jgi:transposase